MKKFLCVLAVCLALPAGWAFGQTPAAGCRRPGGRSRIYADIEPRGW